MRTSLASVGAVAVSALAAQNEPLITNVTIFDPPENYTIPRTLYARTVLLNDDCEEDDVLLTTWENYLPDNDSYPYLPIYQSLDLGRTWTERARVYDQVNGWGLRYQPFLYELPHDIGNYSAGAVLMAANSIPNDLSQTRIDLYASTDKGYTWHFVPVWEPFLMMYEGTLVCYYSDQRDPKHGQKLVHQTTTNLIDWDDVVDDVAYSTYEYRPGMTTVSQLPLGQWILTYEFYGPGTADTDFGVYYRISDSPLTFNDAVGQALIAQDGTIPVSSPYNVWTPVGGPQGTIVVSCGTLSQVFVNHELGAPGAWITVETPEGISYSRNLVVLPTKDQILITGAGQLGGDNNSVTTSSITLGRRYHS